MSDALIEEAYQFMRAHLTGRIRFDHERVEISVAPTPQGDLVASVMVAMLRSVDTVLELPDDGEDSLELQVTLQEISEDGPDGALCDRWCIYHGEPPDVRWARITIDAARYRGYFVDGLALARANPLASLEAAVCRQVNAEHADLLARAAHASGGHKLAAPKLVGVDPWGFDARAQVGIARIPCVPPIPVEPRIPDVAAVIARLEAIARKE